MHMHLLATAQLCKTLKTSSVHVEVMKRKSVTGWVQHTSGTLIHLGILSCKDSIENIHYSIPKNIF